MIPTFGSLFAGIGGFDLGFERVGMRCRWQCENNTHAVSVLRRHWQTPQRIDDVVAFAKLLRRYQKQKNHEALKQYTVDVLCGGSPCQDLSVAGRRAGLDGSRSGLFTQMVRIFRILRPRIVLWENVPGVLSSNKGQDFARVIGYFTGIIPEPPAKGWGNAGFFASLPGMWNVAYRVFDSQFFGVPQRRRRVFLAASLGDASCIEILFDTDCLQGNFAPGSEARKDITGTFTARSSAGGGFGSDFEIAGGGSHVAGCLQERDFKGTDSDTKPGHLIISSHEGGGSGNFD